MTTFRTRQPIAWEFHRNTCRFPHNMHGLNDPTYETPPFSEPRTSHTIRLAEPLDLPGSLNTTLLGRCCCRRFSDRGLQLSQLGTVLHYAYGVTGRIHLNGEMLERPVPSGGGLYPLELHVICQNVEELESGVYHYLAHLHALEAVFRGQLPKHLTAELFLGQPYLQDAGAIIVISALVQRSLWKYEDRGYRYICFEAGHVAQNINLVSTSLKLGSLNLGGFFDDDLAALIVADSDVEVPLYAVAVGQAETEDRSLVRTPSEDAERFRHY